MVATAAARAARPDAADSARDAFLSEALSEAAAEAGETPSEAEGTGADLDLAAPPSARRPVSRYALTAAGAAALVAVTYLTLGAAGRGHAAPSVVPVGGGMNSLTILQSGTSCRNSNEIGLKTEAADTLDKCIALCNGEANCTGVLYQRNSGCDVAKRTCFLYQGSCDVASHECWSRVDVKKLDKFPITGWGMGCDNWKQIRLGSESVEASEAGCFQRCQEYPGCKGFGFQIRQAANEHWGPEKNTCSLWKGHCKQSPSVYWNDYTMTFPTPAIHIIHGTFMFCRNYDEAVLVELPDQADVDACAVQCMLTENCVSFAYKAESSCTSEPDTESSSNCVLFQKECVPEPNQCWSFLRLSQAPEPALGNIPQGVIDDEAGFEKVTELHEKVPDCDQDLSENTITNNPLTSLSTADKCSDACYITPNCVGFLYKAKKCTLLDEICKEGSHKNVPEDLYHIIWPKTSFLTDKKHQKMCSNWNDIQLGPEQMGFGKGDCIIKCSSTIGCVAIQFQYTAGDDEAAIAKGACVLLGDGCKEVDNKFWDLYSLQTETDYSKTSTAMPGSAVHGGHYAGTTITVTTTKRPMGALTIFVNEIRYHSDNPAVPGVEIAGPDGTDLSDHTVYTYNMSGQVTNTVHLDGTIDAQHGQNYGVKWFNIPCHKFTSIALARGPALVQFVSVLDQITAVDPPASGSTSKVIKDANDVVLQVLDSDNTKSLQLFGVGLKYADFQWHKRSSTEGISNALQDFE